MKFNQLIPELNVTNIKKSKDFYIKLLGFEIAYEREEEGFVFLQCDEAQIMLDEIGEGRIWKTGRFEYPMGRGINLQIEVDSIEEMLANLSKENIHLFMKVEEKWYRENDVEWGNRQFLVQDPDGYLLRFTEDLGSRPLK